jgi:Ser/Thr protein kinase RdoA (MazF antagonist)
MPDDWPTRFTREATAKVDAFIAEHPEYTRDGVEQPGQGATNRVFFLRRGADLVVCKVFCEAERKERESFGLRHWRDTGLVPELIYDIDPRTIVMSHVSGTWLDVSRETDGQALWREACDQVGRAIGRLTRVLLTDADRAAFDKDVPTLEAYLRRILNLGRSINARDPDFSNGFWRTSLDFIEGRLPCILAEPRVLYHQDVANLHVRQGRFMGFFDLEMCRVGCATMQLASSLNMLHGDKAAWEPFGEGWEAVTGRTLTPDDLRAAAAAHHLLSWRVISRYLSYDGTPGTGFAWCDPADPVRYRRSIEAVEAMIGMQS